MIGIMKPYLSVVKLYIPAKNWCFLLLILNFNCIRLIVSTFLNNFMAKYTYLNTYLILMFDVSHVNLLNIYDSTFSKNDYSCSLSYQ